MEVGGGWVAGGSRESLLAERWQDHHDHSVNVRVRGYSVLAHDPFLRSKC